MYNYLVQAITVTLLNKRGQMLLQYKENLEMRTRYADEPQKFMESELDLDEEVKKLMAIAGSPELYPDFLRTNTVETLLTLLTHQNTDIVADVIGVFEDLTDADVIEDAVSINLLGIDKSLPVIP